MYMWLSQVSMLHTVSGSAYYSLSIFDQQAVEGFSTWRDPHVADLGIYVEVESLAGYTIQAPDVLP